VWRDVSAYNIGKESSFAFQFKLLKLFIIVKENSVLCAVQADSWYKMQIACGRQSVNISAQVLSYVKRNAAHSDSILGSVDAPFQISLHQ
jgi:hypothetical protein